MPDLNQRGLNSQTILRETIVPRIDITTSDGATVEVTKIPLSTGDSVVEITVQGGGGEVTAEAIDSALGYTPANAQDLTGHESDTSNPHGVTKDQVGLGNVPNVDTTNPANISQTADYRFVTDAEKADYLEGKQIAMSISAGEGGKLYDTLAAAQAVEPKPVDGTVFQVSNNTDPANSGVYTFQSGESGGTRFEKSLDGESYTKKLETGRVNGTQQDESPIYEIIDKRGYVGFRIGATGLTEFVRKPLPVLTRERRIGVVTVAESEPGVSRAFVGMVNVNGRIYIFYRHSPDGHHGYNGTIKSKYSDDFGDTWSEENTAYDATEMQTDHPEIWSAEPTTETDARDPRAIITDDGYLLLVVFVAFGYMTDGARTKTADPITLSLKVPINSDNSLDWINAVKAEFPERINFGGGLTKHNGVIYAGLYLGTAKLFKSEDNAGSWSLVSEISDSGNETALTFCGEILYAVVRPHIDQPEIGGILAISYDYGLTWTTTTTPYQLHGMSSLRTQQNKMLVFGRDQSGDDVGAVAYLMAHDKRDSDLITIQNKVPGGGADFGYGTVIRVENYYLFGWYRADVYQYDAAIYFTKLPVEEIENASLSQINLKLLKEITALDSEATDVDVKAKINEIIAQINKLA